MRGLQELSYYTFPNGNPGVGLLLLRTTIGVMPLLQGGTYLANPVHSILGMRIVGALAVASGASLLIGFLTKAAGLLLGMTNIGIGVSSVPTLTLNSFDTNLSLVFAVSLSVAIIL